MCIAGGKPKYVDKNHAGSLIIMGPYVRHVSGKEEETPVYGVTKPLQSWNALYANVAHYVDMRNDLRRIPYWRDRVRYLFKKPGWLPESLGGIRAVPDVDAGNRIRNTEPKLFYIGVIMFFFNMLSALS